jgi:hypothetical protein
VERDEVERDLLVRVRSPQRVHGGAQALFGNDDLDAILVDAFLLPHFADCRIGALAGQERARPGRVPRAALVVADPAAAGAEDGVARRVARVLGDEVDELEERAQSSTSGAAVSGSPVFGVPSGSMSRIDAPSSERGRCSTPRGTT